MTRIYVTIQVPPQEELNRRICPAKTFSSETLPLNMKYPLLTLQFLEFLIRALFHRKDPQ
jgi:hypothetical protein